MRKPTSASPTYGRYAYESQLHLEVRVARIFNTFGPRMHPNDGRVVSNFIIQVRGLVLVFVRGCAYCAAAHGADLLRV
jgi:nucleoside-diphosphate-sugar epimerase